MRAIAVCFLAGLILAISHSARAGHFPNRHDSEISQAVKRWWPDYPLWRMLKAQLIQESRLDPASVSPVGARGLGQFMPGTWDDMIRQMGLGARASPHDDIAIEAAAFYMAKLRRSWSAPRPQDDRHDLALASYNAGLGNILEAQRLCNGARLYAGIIVCLPSVTGRHSAETIAYVVRIHRWFTEMEAER